METGKVISWVCLWKKQITHLKLLIAINWCLLIKNEKTIYFRTSSFFFFSFVKPDNLSVYPSKMSLQRKKQDQKCELLKIWDLVQNSKPQPDSAGRTVTPKFCLGPHSSLPLTKATYGYKAPLIASTLRKPQYYWLISGRTDTLHVPSSYTPSLQRAVSWQTPSTELGGPFSGLF